MAKTKTTTAHTKKISSITYSPQEDSIQLRGDHFAEVDVCAEEAFSVLYANKRLEHSRELHRVKWDPSKHVRFNDVSYVAGTGEIQLGFWVEGGKDVIMAELPVSEFLELVEASSPDPFVKLCRLLENGLGPAPRPTDAQIGMIVGFVRDHFQPK